MDPNAQNEENEGLDEAIGTTDDTPALEESLDDALSESLDRAIGDDPEGEQADDEPADPPAAEDDPEDNPAEADDPDKKKPEEGTKPDEEDDPGKAPEGDSAEPDADTEAEIASLGLKEKSAARFREMAGEIKELAPLRDQLKAAGVENFAELPQMLERSQHAQDMISMVMDTGASADQYGQTLDYLKVANAAGAGDQKAAEQAFEMAMSEVAVWAKALGREVPGVHDPLGAHKDLSDAVEAGDLDRKHAIELAAARDRTQNLQQHQEQTTQAQQAEVAQSQARQQLVQFDQQMAQDPAYVAKRPMLDAMVRNIRETLPPQQWLQATQQALASIPDAPQQDPPKPREPAPSAVRPGGPRGSLAPQKFSSVEDALDFALDGPASR